ncbi:hypothetical protein TNCT_301231 [Trichonephila clavata]|uniref:Uncharacterized protein n=1 Tax=Trichonephila clavata TaxID=2740835 RepID=A0A8X6GTP8_TRICU|nr:hypothetical protein TNCT_301231 [Trichonephila clavata]
MNQFPISCCQATRIVHRNQLTSSKLEVEPMFTYLSSNLSTVNMHQPLYMTVFREYDSNRHSTKMNQFPISCCQATRIVHRNQLTSSKLEVEPHVYIPVIKSQHS